MEEILASIRRIIADDEPVKPETARPAMSRPEFATVEPARPVNQAEPPRAETALFEAPRPEPVGSEHPASPLQTKVEAPKPKEADVTMAKPAPLDATADESDVFELTEAMASQDALASQETKPEQAPDTSRFQTIGGEPDVVFAETPARQREEPRREQAAPPPVFDQGGLMSSATQSAVDSAFNTLAQTVLVQNARTLEDLVREMLRPMLKTWLDDNLPGLVERLVRAEIERVSRSRG